MGKTPRGLESLIQKLEGSSIRSLVHEASFSLLLFFGCHIQLLLLDFNFVDHSDETG